MAYQTLTGVIIIIIVIGIRVLASVSSRYIDCYGCPSCMVGRTKVVEVVGEYVAAGSL